MTNYLTHNEVYKHLQLNQLNFINNIIFIFIKENLLKQQKVNIFVIN